MIGAAFFCILLAHLNCSGSQRSQGAVFMSGKVPIMKPTCWMLGQAHAETLPGKWSHEEVQESPATTLLGDPFVSFFHHFFYMSAARLRRSQRSTHSERNLDSMTTMLRVSVRNHRKHMTSEGTTLCCSKTSWDPYPLQFHAKLLTTTPAKDEVGSSINTKKRSGSDSFTETSSVFRGQSSESHQLHLVKFGEVLQCNVKEGELREIENSWSFGICSNFFTTLQLVPL